MKSWRCGQGAGGAGGRAMHNGEKFLRIVEVYTGYCQICGEPKLVGRLAVAGWPYHGAVCSRCLADLGNELERRGNPATSSASGSGKNLTVVTGKNGNTQKPGAAA